MYVMWPAVFEAEAIKLIEIFIFALNLVVVWLWMLWWYIVKVVSVQDYIKWGLVIDRWLFISDKRTPLLSETLLYKPPESYQREYSMSRIWWSWYCQFEVGLLRPGYCCMSRWWQPLISPNTRIIHWHYTGLHTSIILSNIRPVDCVSLWLSWYLITHFESTRLLLTLLVWYNNYV